MLTRRAHALPTSPHGCHHQAGDSGARRLSAADLVGGSGEAAFAWDRLIGEALNPTPVARSYSCEDGHLLAAPERSPESEQQQDGGLLLASDAVLAQTRGPASQHHSPVERTVQQHIYIPALWMPSAVTAMPEKPSQPLPSCDAFAAAGGDRRQATADAAVAAADSASEGSDAEAGRNDAQDGADAAGRAAPAEAFVQVSSLTPLCYLRLRIKLLQICMWPSTMPAAGQPRQQAIASVARR